MATAAEKQEVVRLLLPSQERDIKSWATTGNIFSLLHEEAERDCGINAFGVWREQELLIAQVQKFSTLMQISGNNNSLNERGNKGVLVCL